MAIVINELDMTPDSGSGPADPGQFVWQDRVALWVEGERHPQIHVESFTCQEELSKLYRLEVEFTYDQSVSYRPNSFLGRRVAVQITRLERERFFCGIVTNFVGEHPMGRHMGGQYYRIRLTVMPRVWLLTQNIRSRVLPADQSLADLMHSEFSHAGFSEYDINISCSDRRPRVQFEETDFQFLSRVCEEMGVFYFFDQQGADRERLIFADQVTGYRTRDCSAYAADFLNNPWEDRQQVCPSRQGAVGYDFIVGASEGSSVTTTHTAQSIWPEQHRYERIPYNSAAYNVCDEQARLRMESSEWRTELFAGEGNAFELMPGFFVPSAGTGSDVVMVSVNHEYSDRFGYQNHFTCMPRNTVFRPPRMTPRPSIAGALTAIVIDNWDPDAMGRVSLQFFWDRSPEISPCWARVSYPWAGKSYGAYFPPQKGDEVVVNFLDGDPAQPIVVSRVYNGSCNDQHSVNDVSGWTSVNGAKIEIDDKTDDFGAITIAQESGNEAQITNNGAITVTHFSGSKLVLDPTGAIKLVAAARLSLEAPLIQVSGIVNIDSAIVRCSGMVKCDKLIANNVISTSYTPGAGNIW